VPPWGERIWTYAIRPAASGTQCSPNSWSVSPGGPRAGPLKAAPERNRQMVNKLVHGAQEPIVARNQGHGRRKARPSTAIEPAAGRRGC